MSCPMTTCMCHMPPAADDVQAFGLIRNAWRAYWEGRARRVIVLLLSSLDACTLRAIGISPAEVEALVNCSDGRRRYDMRWVWRCDRR